MASQIAHLSYGAVAQSRFSAGAASCALSRPMKVGLGSLRARAQAQACRSAVKCAGLGVNSLGYASSSVAGESLWRRVIPQSSTSETSSGGAIGSTCSYGFYGFYGVAPETIRWGLAAACTLLLLKRDAGARKQFWAAILALEAPRDVVYWSKSDYGLWVACVCLALKIFYPAGIPAELDYPLAVYLFIATAPAAAVAVRGTLGAAVTSTLLALFVAYQYFTNTVRLSDAFKGEHLINTIAIVFINIACIGFLGMTI